MIINTKKNIVSARKYDAVLIMSKAAGATWNDVTNYSKTLINDINAPFDFFSLTFNACSDDSNYGWFRLDIKPTDTDIDTLFNSYTFYPVACFGNDVELKSGTPRVISATSTNYVGRYANSGVVNGMKGASTVYMAINFGSKLITSLTASAYSLGVIAIPKTTGDF